MSEWNDELKIAVFEFFRSFSRLEFALKESGRFLMQDKFDNAHPCWKAFQKCNRKNYSRCADATALLDAPPERQIVRNGELDWECVNLSRGDVTSDLDRVVLVVKTIRNNLFHGGKSPRPDDDPTRHIFLLTRATRVVERLAKLDADVHAAYDGRY